MARGLLRRLEDRGVRPGAEAGADGRVLPVVPPLDALLPWAGLRRGTTVAVIAERAGPDAGAGDAGSWGGGTARDARAAVAGAGGVEAAGAGAGATSLLLALLAGASAAGAWAGVVGRPELGLVAAAEAGIALERLALVPYPGADLVAVVAALLDGLDLVAVSRPGALRAADRQRLAARARQRGAVLVALGPWPGADVELGVVRGGWQGVGDAAGGGRLRARRVHVRLRGRGVAAAGREATLSLPGPDGRPGTAPDPAVARLQEAG